MSGAPPVDITAIGDVVARQRVRVAGRVRSVRVRPWADVPTLEVVLVDDSGGLALVFLGRRRIPGIGLGTLMTAEGVPGAHQRRLAVLNPAYVLLPPPPTGHVGPSHDLDAPTPGRRRGLMRAVARVLRRG